MKEYIKLFENLQSADGYIIADIPFTTTVKRDAESLDPQNARCNETNMKLVKVNNEIHLSKIRIQQENTILVLSDGSEVELTGTSITREMTSAYKSTLVEAIVGTNVTKLGSDSLMELALMMPFGDCSLLTSITIPNSVTELYELGCTGLTSIVIPDSVIKIGSRSFNEYEALTSVTLGSGITSIPEYAFGHCSDLTSITIPSSVTSIGDGAFSECAPLTIYYGGTVSNWNSIDMDSYIGLEEGAVVHCSDGDVIIP